MAALPRRRTEVTECKPLPKFVFSTAPVQKPRRASGFASMDDGRVRRGVQAMGAWPAAERDTFLKAVGATAVHAFGDLGDASASSHKRGRGDSTAVSGGGPASKKPKKVYPRESEHSHQQNRDGKQRIADERAGHERLARERALRLAGRQEQPQLVARPQLPL